MRAKLRIAALLLALAVFAVWISCGQNPGWTKDSVPHKVKDPVTELEVDVYEKQFVPGVDFLGAGLVAAGLMAAGSFYFAAGPARKPELSDKICSYFGGGMASINPMKRVIPILAFAGLQLAAYAAPQAFDFKDPKGVNNVVFKTDAPLESINGTATGVSGSVVFDPENPGTLKGKIVVEAASLHVPNSTMQGHLRSDKWLDVAKYPDITFESASVDNVKTEANKTTADVTGTLTIKGVSNKVTAPVQLTYLKDRLKDRFPALKGDFLVLRARFTIKRGDFGINKGFMEDKVSDEIELTLSLAGQAPHD